ncbi:MAG: hypothetical protein AAFX04_10740 [Pseudomonadota bacterium]
MDAVSAALINKALDGLTMRMTATADNIANSQTPGFVPMMVRFEDALRAASDQGLDAIAKVAPELESRPLPPGASAAGQTVRMDMELATARMTQGRYAALLDLLNRQMQLDHIVIKGVQ